MRTNSESILAVTVPQDDSGTSTRAVAITLEHLPRPDTHIELVTYGQGGDSHVDCSYTLIVADGTRVTRPLSWLRARSSAIR